MPEVITNNLDLWSSALLTKSTAGRGSNGKLEAYGIRKLRELILGTALRGLFDEKNESLPRTIERDIGNARNSYYKQIGKKPKEYNFGPALLKEFDLPTGWAWKRVGDLCDLQTGATPSTQNPKYFGGDIRWLVSGDINQGIIKDCEGRITEAGLINSNCKILPPNTVLIALNGQGKTRASVALLNVPAACNQSLVGIIPFDASILDSTFLLLSLRYRYYEIRDITGQNQRRGLNMGLVAELSIPLPPLAEQHRIVAKVDELMALCDQLEQQQIDSLAAHQTLVASLLGTLTRVESQQEFSVAWTRISSHFDTLFTTEASIDQLKQTILQLAVMGKLAPQDPSDEPASVLLEKIARKRGELIKEGKLKKQSSIPDVTEDEKLCELPPGWEFVRFGTVTFNRDAERVPLSVEERSGRRGEYDYYGASGVIDSIDDFLFDKPLLLIGEDGANLINRSTPIAFMARGKYWVNNHAHVLDGLIEDLLLYVCLHINAITLEPYVTGTAQPKMNQAKMNSIVLALPPMEEQKRIVAKVDELMALCDTLKARLADAQTTQIHLADAIVEQAVC